MPTLELRRAVLDGITEREIVIRVAPYGDTAELPGGIKERFNPGAFGEIPDGIALKLETANGHSGPVIGVATGWDDRADGLFGTFKIAETRDGDDALELAGMGALGASAGFLLDPANVKRNRSDGAMEIGSADLREVTLTATPAYALAGPVEIRSTNEGKPNMDQVTETAPEATPDVDVDALISAAVEKAVDETRSQIVATSAELPTVEAEHRGHEYRSLGEVLGDVIAYTRRTDSGAAERLTRSIDSGMVARDGSAINLVTRAFSTPETSLAGGIGISPDTYVPEILELLREGRPCADLFNGRQLPARGNNVDLPRITTGTTVGYQATQNLEVSNQNLETDLVSFPKSTMAGGQGYSLQSAQWSDPSYADEVIRDLVAAYSEFLDGETIIGDGATPNATAYTGILDGATDVPIGGTFVIADLLAKIGTAWAAVFQGSRRAPIAFVGNSATWGLLLDAVDTDGRPIVTTDAPTNPIGSGNAGTIAGSLRGLPFVLDENVPSDAGVGTDESPLILGSFRDALLFEDSANPAQIGITYPDVLTTDVTVFGFSALAIRRPAAFAVLSGLITG